jgi:hypothetical protein
MSKDGSFPSRPRHIPNSNARDGRADRALVRTAKEQRPEHGDGAPDDDTDRLPPGDLAPPRLRLQCAGASRSKAKLGQSGTQDVGQLVRRIAAISPAVLRRIKMSVERVVMNVSLM